MLTLSGGVGCCVWGCGGVFLVGWYFESSATFAFFAKFFNRS